MEAKSPVFANVAAPATSSLPPCTQCGHAGTEPVVTMQRGTVDADRWYRCEECGHVFAESDGE